MTFERLTMRNSDGTVSQPTGTTVESVFYRLAEYEDTDLRPEDIVEYKKFEDWLVQNGTTIAHVIELLQAEKDGLVTIQKRFVEGCCGGCYHFLRERGSDPEFARSGSTSTIREQDSRFTAASPSKPALTSRISTGDWLGTWRARNDACTTKRRN